MVVYSVHFLCTKNQPGPPFLTQLAISQPIISLTGSSGSRDSRQTCRKASYHSHCILFRESFEDPAPKQVVIKTGSCPLLCTSSGAHPAVMTLQDHNTNSAFCCVSLCNLSLDWHCPATNAPAYSNRRYPRRNRYLTGGSLKSIIDHQNSQHET